MDFSGGYGLPPHLSQRYSEENLENREHIALTYATKQDVKDDLQQIMGRFDRLEDKIDDYMRSTIHDK